MGYRAEAGTKGWSGADLTTMARHLFDGYTIVDMAYQQTPHSILWVVRSDGAVLSLSYLREQGVMAWAQHEFRGQATGNAESVCCVPEGGEDAVYFVVTRTVDGSTYRYVERLSTPHWTAQADCFRVDCGVTRTSGSPFSTITDLWHLEGESVVALADGNAMGPYTVTNGTITLSEYGNFSKVHVGYPIRSDLQTLPLHFITKDGYGIGKRKNVSSLALRVERSRNVLAGPNFTDLREIPQRTTEVYGAPIEPYTGILETNIPATWQKDAQFCIRSEKPLPLHILSIIPEVAGG
jgi:hypothetical protein